MRRSAARSGLEQIGVGLVAALVASGCAASRSGSLTDRLIRSGEPQVRIDQPVPLEQSLEAFVAKVRHLAATAQPSPRDPLETIEARDPELAAALSRLVVAPTPENHHAVADAYRRVGVLDAAHTHLQRALRLDRTSAAAHDGLARLWRDWGLPHLGMGDVARAIYYAPQSPAPHNTMGTLLQAMGRSREAGAAYRRALERDPRAAYAFNNLCYLSLLEGETAIAIAQCRAAMANDPTLVAARNNLGLAYAAAGRLDLAEREFLEAGDRATARYNIGLVHLADANFGQAAAAFEAALEARPTWRAAQLRAQQARALQDQPALMEALTGANP